MDRFFKAVSIEHVVGRLMGNYQRGQAWDADVFRGGNPIALSEMLELVADALEQRYAFLPLRREPATPGALLGVSVAGLRDSAAHMRTLTEDEPENYHWEIFCSLLTSTIALLEVVEAMQPRQ